MAVAIVLVLASYLALQAYAPWRWSGRWRAAALAPLLAMLPLAVLSASLLAQDSNLWPLPFLFASPVALLFLLVLAAARRTLASPPSSRAPG
jgi:hypothetical protein